MIAPINRLKKSEIVWLHNHYCKHKHRYLDHYTCYLNECPDRECKTGFFDIEASNLKANFGIMLCYCIKEADSDKIWEGQITKKDLQSKDLDKKVIAKCLKDLARFDKIVTYYGTGYDLPFVRTRALHHGIDFPGYGEFLHEDVYYIVKSKLNLHRKSMEVACKMVIGEDLSEKNHYDPMVWIRGLQGHKPSLDHILDHCQRDVRDLQRLHEVMIPFRKRIDRSV